MAYGLVNGKNPVAGIQEYFFEKLPIVLAIQENIADTSMFITMAKELPVIKNNMSGEQRLNQYHPMLGEFVAN
jgi:hypothetical protein